MKIKVIVNLTAVGTSVNVWHCLCYVDFRFLSLKHTEQHYQSKNQTDVHSILHSSFKKGTVSTQSAHKSVATFWGFYNRKGKQQVLHDSNHRQLKCLKNGISILHPLMPMTTTAEAHYTNSSSVNIVKHLLKFSASVTVTPAWVVIQKYMYTETT